MKGGAGMSELLKSVLLSKAARKPSAATQIAAASVDDFAPWQSAAL
jgi:hypothetical protein